jgi:hypothetical protein
MKPSSAKQKGRAAQQLVRDALIANAPGLTTNDIRSVSMGASGVDILMSEAALKIYPFAIEVKCQESLNIWAGLAQAEENKAEGLTPLLCFKRNRTDMYVAMKLEDFLRVYAGT